MTVHGAQYPHSHLQLLSQSLKDGEGTLSHWPGPPLLVEVDVLLRHPPPPP